MMDTRVRSIFILVSMLLLLIVIGTACKEDTPPTPIVVNDPCSGLALSAEDASVAEPVTILGLASPNDQTMVEVEGPVTKIEIGVAQRDDGSTWLSTPAHPDLAGDAGEVTLSVRFGGSTCKLGKLTIAALPPAAENVADDTLALLETVALQLNQSFDFDPGGFDPATSTSPTEILQALVYYTLLDAASPARVSEQRARLAALTTEERIFVGRWLVQIGLPDLLQELLSAYSGVFIEVEDSAAAPAAAGGGLGASVGNLAILEALEVARPQAGGECAALFGGNVSRASIAGAQELSDALILARDAGERLGAQAGRRQVAGALLTAASFAGTPGQIVSLAGGAFLFLQDAGDTNAAMLLPSSITDTRIELSVNPINEDYLDKAGNTLPSWFAFSDAASAGLNISKRALDAALLASGAVSLPAQASASLGALGVGSGFVFDPRQSEEATCFNVPPATWGNINVTERRWLKADPELTGTSIVLVSPNKLRPVQTGSTKIAIDLDPDQFPCSGVCVDFAEENVEIAKKEVVFARARYPAASETALVTLTAAIQNSSVPEQYELTVGDGATEVSTQQSGVQFSIEVQGGGDRVKFPVDVTLESTSTNLPLDTSPRQGSALVTLEAEVEITRLAPADGCIRPDTEVLLQAEVTGVAPGDDLVIWSTMDAISISQAGRNQITAVASAPGRYVVVATSEEDPEAEAEYEIVVSTCDVQLSYFAEARVGLDRSNEASGCAEGSLPDGDDDEDLIGELPNYDNRTLHHLVDWSGGGSWPVNLDLQTRLVSSYKNDVDQCRTVVVNERGYVNGLVSSQPDSGSIDFDLNLGISGGCDKNLRIPGDRVCKEGRSGVIGTASFVIDVDADSAGLWVVEGSMTCTFPKIPPPPGVPIPLDRPNIFINAAGMDATGELIGPDAFLDFGSIIALGNLAALSCYQDEVVDFSVEFRLREPDASETYSVTLVMGFAFGAFAPDPIDPDFEGRYSETVSAVGTVTVRPSTD